MITLEIWAAIDLRHGRVVTLHQGNPALGLTWNDGPLNIADRWEHEGATGLHVVDLDGALGDGSNQKLIESISRNSKIPVQVGGGVRTIARAEELLELGISRVILGTAAYDEHSILIDALHALGSDRLVVAVDYRDDVIVTKGWTKESSMNVLEAATALENYGVETILATAVEFDGTALGPDLETLRKIRSLTRMKILASGGIRSPQDIKELQRIGVDGAVVGRALYEGTVRMKEISGKVN